MANLVLSRPIAAKAAARSPSRALTWLGERGLVVALLLISLVAHGLNMFHYPAFTFKDDEGIYAAQAWAVLREGRLAPYTYFYDHAPGGWLLLAGWLGLTGGPGTFGGVIESGRLLMLVLHLAMVPLLYQIGRKFGAGPAAAAIATLFFSLSPLAIFYQRLLLLDTIMLFWLMISLNLLLDGWGQLSRLWLSGACFGLAILSKETAVVLLPAWLFIAYHQRWQHQGHFALTGWLVPLLLVVSWYPLYALLKGELLPAGGASFSAAGYARANVSLVDALLWQATRGGGGPFNLNNDFWQLLRGDWLPRDGALIVAGSLATGLNLLRGWRDRRALAVGLLGLLPLLYLARGGVVFSYYILVAIPFLCLNLASGLAPLLARLPRRLAATVPPIALVAMVGGYSLTGTLAPLYTERPSEAGHQAVSWIKQTLPPSSRIIIRDDLWTALHEPSTDGPAFPHAHSHWKVANDPAVRTGLFGDDWRTVDYLVISPDLDRDFSAEGNTVALTALRNAHLVKRWQSARGSEALHPHQIVELWKVDGAGATEQQLLAESAAFLTRRFERDGAYRAVDGTVTSEAQSYALLRAVWSDDRAAFDRAWAWTQANLLDERGLLAWLWRDGAVIDANSATDADTDTALALLLAGRRWHDPALTAAGQRMVQAIWQHEVAIVNGVPYITAGDWAVEGAVVALNPSYFSPYAYRIFQEVTPEHDWQGVIDSGYWVIFAASRATLGASRSAGLPPDWVGLERASGELGALQIDRGDTTRYSYDAARTYWRVALDRRWHADGRAEAYLQTTGFLRDEINRLLADGQTRKGRVSAAYARDGTVVEEAPSLVGTSGALAALLTLDPDAAATLYAGQVIGPVQRHPEGLAWGDGQDIYAQEWGWFAVALYAHALPDLWRAP